MKARFSKIKSRVKAHEKSGNELGISNGKPTFSPNFDQEQFKKYVDKKADHIPETGQAVGKPSDFTWSFKPDFPLDKLTPIKSDWKKWYEGEISEWVHDHGPKERAGHFENWAEDPEKKPPIVIEGTQGKLHVWDGHHRIAMAHIKDFKTLPIIYGERK